MANKCAYGFNKCPVLAFLWFMWVFDYLFEKNGLKRLKCGFNIPQYIAGGLI